MSSAHEVRMSLALALSLLTSCLLSAQYLNRRDPKTPGLSDGKPVVFHFSTDLPITPAFVEIEQPTEPRPSARATASVERWRAGDRDNAKRLQRP